MYIVTSHCKLRFSVAVCVIFILAVHPTETSALQQARSRLEEPKVLLRAGGEEALWKLNRIEHGRVNQVADKIFENEEIYHRKRKKRAVSALITLAIAIRKGNKIIAELLKDARLVSISDDGTKLYEKSGGSKQMLKDFFGMKPTDVRPNLFWGETYGRVGDRTVSFETDKNTGIPVMVVYKRKLNGDFIIDKIEYKN